MMSFVFTLFIVIYECYSTWDLCLLIRKHKIASAICKGIVVAIIIAFGALLMVHGYDSNYLPPSNETQWNSKVFLRMIPLTGAAAFYMFFYLNRKMAKMRRKSGTTLGIIVSGLLMLLFAWLLYCL